MENTNIASGSSPNSSDRPLSLEEYKRYGRQMIMPGWGLPGQIKVKKARVAVIGAGGLGCPCLQYLAGAGVGTIGIIDHDTVDISNLHRQVLHTSERVGMNKAESAAKAMDLLNLHIAVQSYPEPITPINALAILKQYDIIVDCTDRPLTRYLLSDASVLLSKPLVSGAAISNIGQWAVYNGVSSDGSRRACYRCMWPKVVGDGGGKCDELGVWGPVVGLVGISMAGEVLRLITEQKDDEHLLHFYTMGGNPLVRTIKMRKPSVKCISCGPERNITNLEEYDYDSFCSGVTTDLEGVNGVDRINAKDFALQLRKDPKCVVVDTRPAVEFEICSIPNTINVPFDRILKDIDSLPKAEETVFICRRGNDSLVAANTLRQSLEKKGENGSVKDVVGGLVAWARDVDSDFPVY